MSKKIKDLLFNTLKTFLEDHGFQAHVLDQEETEYVIGTWKKKFLIKPLDKNESLWHTFGFNHFPSESDDNAVKKFNETLLKEFIVFSTMDLLAIRCTTSFACIIQYEALREKLNTLPHHMDIFIVQSNF